MTDYLCTVTPLKCIRNCFIFFFVPFSTSHTHTRTIRMLVCLIVVDVVFVFLYLLAFCSIHKSIVFQFILYRNAGDDFFPLLALIFHLRRIVVEQPKQKPKMKQQKNREQRQRQFWKFQNSPALMRSLSLSRALGFNIDFYSYGIVNPRRQTQHKNDMKMMEEEEEKNPMLELVLFMHFFCLWLVEKESQIFLRSQIYMCSCSDSFSVYPSAARIGSVAVCVRLYRYQSPVGVRKFLIPLFFSRCVHRP